LGKKGRTPWSEGGKKGKSLPTLREKKKRKGMSLSSLREPARHKEKKTGTIDDRKRDKENKRMIDGWGIAEGWLGNQGGKSKKENDRAPSVCR